MNCITVVVVILLTAVKVEMCLQLTNTSLKSDQFDMLDCSFEVQNSFCCWVSINWKLSTLSSANHAEFKLQSERGTLTSKEFPSTGQDGLCLQFQFFLEGINVTLRVILKSTNTTLLWSLFANQTYTWRWKHASVFINTSESFQIIIEAGHQNGSTIVESNIHIDEVKHTQNFCPTKPSMAIPEASELYQWTQIEEEQNGLISSKSTGDGGTVNVGAFAGSVTAAIVAIVITIVAVISIKQKRRQTSSNSSSCEVDAATHSVNEIKVDPIVNMRDSSKARNVYSAMRIEGFDSKVTIKDSDYSEIEDTISHRNSDLYSEIHDMLQDNAYTMESVDISPYQDISHDGGRDNTGQTKPSDPYQHISHDEGRDNTGQIKPSDNYQHTSHDVGRHYTGQIKPSDPYHHISHDEKGDNTGHIKPSHPYQHISCDKVCDNTGQIKSSDHYQHISLDGGRDSTGHIKPSHPYQHISRDEIRDNTGHIKPSDNYQHTSHDGGCDNTGQVKPSDHYQHISHDGGHDNTGQVKPSDPYHHISHDRGGDSTGQIKPSDNYQHISHDGGRDNIDHIKPSDPYQHISHDVGPYQYIISDYDHVR